MTEKQQLLIKNIKEFMYDYKFNKKVISSFYLKSLLYFAYSDNSRIEPYSIICGDFNKLNYLNLQYGLKEGDRCLDKGISLISEMLPKNTKICRYGGDEFLFIIPGKISKEQINEYIKNIHNILKQNEQNLHNLTISLSHGNSEEAKSLESLYALVDDKILKEKLELDSNTIHYQTYATLYNALRLSPDHEFTTSETKKMISFLIDATCQMLKQYKETGKLMPETFQSDKDLSTNDKNKSVGKLQITLEDAIKLNELFLNKNLIDDDDIKNIQTETLEKIAKELVFSDQHNAFSKDYYNYFLEKNLPKDKKSRAVLLSLSGLKLSNLLIGHSLTDRYLYKSNYHNIKKNIDSILPLCNDLFNPNGECYKVAIGGADILYIEPEKSRYRPKDEFYRENDNEPLLKYVKISTTHPIYKDEIADFVRYAQINSKSKKDEIKKGIYDTPYALEIAKVCVKASLEKYINNHKENYLDINNVREFIEIDCEQMLNLQKMIEKENIKTVFTPSDIHFDYCYNDGDNQHSYINVDR